MSANSIRFCPQRLRLPSGRHTAAALTAPRVGFTVSFGISDNKVQPVDNRLAGHLGYIPQDNTERFRDALEARTPVPDPKAPAVRCLGGFFVEMGHPDDPQP